MDQEPVINTAPELKHDIQNPMGSFGKVEKHTANNKKSYDFLLTLTAIMFISGGYAIWFFLNLPAEIEAETINTPYHHNRIMMATSSAESGLQN